MWSTEALAATLATVRHKQGRHLGRLEALGFGLRQEASLTMLTTDVVKSSAIEGESLNPGEVRSSIARRLGLEAAGLPPADRRVEGVVEMMLDATQRYADPLTVDRLHGWHAALFPTGRSGMFTISVGAWRNDMKGPMQVVSGPIGRERVHFQAPAADRLEVEMQSFLQWFNGPVGSEPVLPECNDSVLKAALAHFWFVTIHPYDDGNGRIARAVADLALARADGSHERFYSMSTAIEAEKKEYYLQLEAAQRGSLDVTSWVAWFLGCLGRALDASAEILNAVLNKAQFWQLVNVKPVNDRQRVVLNRMLDAEWEGFLTRRKYLALAKCSADTALRDISELVQRGILIRNRAQGRSTSYRLATPAELAAHPSG